MSKAAAASTVAAPSLGPTALVLFGIELPIAALALSLLGLILARYIRPSENSRLSVGQERALTVLLGLLLVVIVSGELSLCSIGEFFGIGGGGECARRPLGVGMATAWGIGLGGSGLLAVDLLAARVSLAFRALVEGRAASREDKSGGE